MTERVFAFWTHDRFPYVIGAAGEQIGPSVMLLDGFGRWGMTAMFAFQPVEQGFDTMAKLEALRLEYREAEHKLLEEYTAKALKILPSLALTKAYGGKIK